jgi:hypothetical protein
MERDRWRQRQRTEGMRKGGCSPGGEAELQMDGRTDTQGGVRTLGKDGLAPLTALPSSPQHGSAQPCSETPALSCWLGGCMRDGKDGHPGPWDIPFWASVSSSVKWESDASTREGLCGAV